MMTHSPPAAWIALCLACVLHGGCAGRPVVMSVARQPVLDSLPAAEPGQDHYIAWIPGTQAATPTAARALMHVALGRARAEAGRELCAGSGLVSGGITGEWGPVPALDPQHPDRAPAWYYRISQQPGLHGCDSRRQEQLYRALQARLPGWITLQMARTTARNTALTGHTR